jgi:hypothetical protein
MTAKKTAGMLLSVVVVAAVAWGGYWLLQRRNQDTCRICQRQIHAEGRAVIEVEGKQEAVCCARCALTYGYQQRRKVRLVEVTDYVSRRPLAPEAAYYVEGSRVVLCEKHEPMLDQTMHAYHPVFDRCVPSVYAFARREEAEAFAEANGGVVRRLPQLLEETGSRP